MKTSLLEYLDKSTGADQQDLRRILEHIAKASISINESVTRAGLLDITGSAGSENVQGETQQKLDLIADNAFIVAMKTSGAVAGIASEENDDFLSFDGMENKEYVVLFDPLDGSSNIDVNISIGTIFSIYKRKSSNSPVTEEDFLQPGTKQVAAGYVLYGTSTMMVLTTGNGVAGLTLEPTEREFYVSHPNLKTPDSGKIFSLNEGNLNSFPKRVINYVNYCKEIDIDTNRPYSARYIGSMVADFHRNMLKGGIFIYPETAQAPNGKLRLLYECNPLSFIAEQAGAAGSDGKQRILEVTPTELHQRTPIYLGSKKMVEKVLSM